MGQENATSDFRELREEELEAVTGGLVIDLGWIVVDAQLYRGRLCVGWATQDSSGGFSL
jgi:bacteriocin-like protein